jgi:predicted dinucleotide-binding enzyme
MKIAIIGTGNVGKSLGKGLIKKGHEVIYGSRNPESKKKEIPRKAKITNIKDAANQADVIILAVPFHAARELINTYGLSEINKVVIDVTNSLTPDFKWAIGFNSSSAEEIARMLPKAKVVKAFNTIFAENMSRGKLGRETLTLFIAGDDENAKAIAKKLGEDLGFDVVDVGPLTIARYLEPLGLLMIHLGYNLNFGTDIGIKLVRAKKDKKQEESKENNQGNNNGLQ